MTASNNLLHVEIHVQADDGSNKGVQVATVDAEPRDIRFTPTGGVLRDGSPLQDAVHAALHKRYGAIMGGGFALVVDGKALNDCRINRAGGDSQFICARN